jgi:hypothetical protein
LWRSHSGSTARGRGQGNDERALWEGQVPLAQGGLQSPIPPGESRARYTEADVPLPVLGIGATEQEAWIAALHALPRKPSPYERSKLKRYPRPGRPSKGKRRSVGVRIAVDLHNRILSMAAEATRRTGNQVTFSDALNDVLRQALGTEYCKHGQVADGSCDRCYLEAMGGEAL